jgi:hypothetical protein
MSASKRIAFARHLGRHLSELTRVLGRNVRREDLLSLEESEAILARSKATLRAPDWKITVPFEDKNLPWFRDFTRALGSAHAGRVYLWTPLASDCGLPKSVFLSEIDFGFPFDLNPEGILEVLTDDLKDRLILDYSLGEGDRAELEIEVSGPRWGGVPPDR